MILTILYGVLVAMSNTILFEIIGICTIGLIALSFLSIICCFIILLIGTTITTIKAGKGLEFLLKTLFGKLKKTLDKNTKL